ncbi:hypothetical protein B0H13DRAFT_1885189 [Mycena leptocephala]|nr:hypothetical protein B0H13DRAFT_1885189 [Mycena leptocephala]
MVQKRSTKLKRRNTGNTYADGGVYRKLMYLLEIKTEIESHREYPASRWFGVLRGQRQHEHARGPEAQRKLHTRAGVVARERRQATVPIATGAGAPTQRMEIQGKLIIQLRRGHDGAASSRPQMRGVRRIRGTRDNILQGHQGRRVRHEIVSRGRDRDVVVQEDDVHGRMASLKSFRDEQNFAKICYPGQNIDKEFPQSPRYSDFNNSPSSEPGTTDKRGLGVSKDKCKWLVYDAIQRQHMRTKKNGGVHGSHRHEDDSVPITCGSRCGLETE